MIRRAIRWFHRSLSGPRIRAALHGDLEAVSDVMGSILLVGITVTVMTGLSIVVLSTPGPTEQVQADATVDLHPGQDGAWGTGDEEIRLAHKGGEPMPRDRTAIHYSIDGIVTTVSGNGLDGAFTDGRLSIDEVFVIGTTLDADSEVAVDVVVKGDKEDTLVTSREIQVAMTGVGP